MLIIDSSLKFWNEESLEAFLLFLKFLENVSKQGQVIIIVKSTLPPNFKTNIIKCLPKSAFSLVPLVLKC